MRLHRLALACLLLAVAPGPGRVAASTDLDMPHLRPDTPDSRRLIDQGLDGSATFRRLVARLDASDVIVYVRLRYDLPDSLGGVMHFITRTPTCRYVLVSINRRIAVPMQVALLGHELRHAVEVADAPDVRSEAELRTLYTRIGIRVRADAYDSRAAQEAGFAVRAELHEAPSAAVLVRHASGQDPRGDALLRGASIEAVRP